MKKGNPAAAIAIIASIFGAAGVVCLLPETQREQLLSSEVLPSRATLVMSAVAASVVAQSAVVEPGDTPARVPLPPVTRIALSEIYAYDLIAPLQFTDDAGAAPPLLATHLSFISAAAEPIVAEPLTTDDGRIGPVPAALDRTGSVLVLAFRKTGAGVKTAFSVLTP